MIRLPATEVKLLPAVFEPEVTLITKFPNVIPDVEGKVSPPPVCHSYVLVAAKFLVVPGTAEPEG